MDPIDLTQGYCIEVEDHSDEEDKERKRRRRQAKKRKANRRETADRLVEQQENKIGSESDSTAARPLCIPHVNPTILVMAGGGSKIVAMLGAMVHIVERVPDFLDRIHTWVGTSAGAMLSLLLCCGYTIKELQKELTELDMPSLATYDISSLMVGKGMGLSDGNKYLEWISLRMVKKGINPSITLRQLKSLTNRSLVTVTTDLYSRSTYLFDCDQDPDVPAIFAVRASFGIPLMFTKVFYKDKCLLDGGLAMNFPYRAIVKKLPIPTTDIVFGIDLAFRNVHQGNESLVDYISLLGELFIGLQSPAQDEEEMRNGKSQPEQPHRVHNISLSRQYPLLQATENDKDDLYEDGYQSVY